MPTLVTIKSKIFIYAEKPLYFVISLPRPLVSFRESVAKLGKMKHHSIPNQKKCVWMARGWGKLNS
jgi:hypothetical protein